MRKEFFALTFLLLFGLANATTISSCQGLSNSNTWYNMTGNITAPAGSTCMTINATNVTLDCQGFAILNGNLGIYINESNATVMNCMLKSQAVALSLESIENGTFTNDTFIGNTYAMNFTNINETNKFTANFIAGNLTSFTLSATNMVIMDVAPVALSATMVNATNYILIDSPDTNSWINLNITYDPTSTEESTLSLFGWISGYGWTPFTGTQNTAYNHIVANITAPVTTTFTVIGCPAATPYYYGGACYVYIELSVSEVPPNYIVGDIVTLFASFSASANATGVALYYVAPNGTTYLRQNFLYNPVYDYWFGIYKLRQSSEYLQAVAYDNSSGTEVPIGFGTFTLNEKPPLSWSDWLLIFAGAIGGVILLLFIIKWIWEGV
jgi:hypothetical protein